MPLVVATFEPLDWVVLGAYFALLAVTGVVFGRRKQRGTEDYFLGGRRMPVWAVAISILATSQSAATFIGGPQQAYKGDLTYLSSNIGMVIAALIVAFVFIPVFYRKRVETPYGLLATRFGPASSKAGSVAFLIGRVFASGARIYIAAIPVAQIVFGVPTESKIPAGQLGLAIAMLTAVGIVYTLAGGIRSVIWTDVIQCGVYVGATVGAMFLLLDKIPLGLGGIYDALAHADGGSKLRVLDVGLGGGSGPGGIDFSANYTLLTAVIGFTLMGVASYGTDQDMVQRMLTCDSPAKGSWTVIAGNLVGIPVVLLFLVVGLLLYVFYQRPDLMGASAPGYAPYDSGRIFLSFILREMPGGVAGLMLAGLFAAGLSSVNSTLNAMSSTFVSDIYRSWAPGRDERHYLVVGRWGVAACGIVLGAFASLCIWWQRSEDSTLIDFALGVMVFAYSGLLGVFFTALFTRRGNSASVIAALLVGFCTILVMQKSVWAWWTALTPESWGLAGVELKVAFPWQLLIASSLAFAVCAAGRPRRGGEPA